MPVTKLTAKLSRHTTFQNPDGGLLSVGAEAELTVRADFPAGLRAEASSATPAAFLL
jgi:hypothetical protein